MTSALKIDAIQGGSRFLDKSTMDGDAVSSEYGVESNDHHNEDEYDVASDDDFEVVPFNANEVLVQKHQDYVLPVAAVNKEEKEEDIEDFEVFEEEIEVIEEEIYEVFVEEELGNDIITENADDSDADDMSFGSSVGDYDPDRPIIINPADIPTISQEAYTEDAAQEEDAKKKSKSKKSKSKKEKSSKSKKKSSTSSPGDLGEKKKKEEEEEEESSKKSRSRSKRRSSCSKTGTRTSGSKSSTRSSKSKSSKRSSKSRSRSNSRSNLGKDEDSKKKEKRRSKRSVSVDEMELGVAIADDVGSQTMAELSALEAELNRSISLFTMKNTPNPDSLKEILNSSTHSLSKLEATPDAPERPRMERMQSMPDLAPEKHPRGREVKGRRALRRRSRSKIHLLEGEDDEEDSSKANEFQSKERQYGSMNDLSKLVSEMKTSTINATWDKAPESPVPSKPPSLSSVLDAETGNTQESSEVSAGGTASLSAFSGEVLLSPRPERASFAHTMASPSRLVRAASLSKLMSYSSFEDDLLVGDEDSHMTPKSRRRKTLSKLIAKKASYNTGEGEDEDFTLTPRSRRKRIMKMGSLFGHSSARDLGEKAI
mmetsp:Transcript_2281/g.5203  ORF Transcript_2281/g.5203 Transcript_2281/m.5203 type:complete len:597 (+) Transcript_2281:82-1872(+)